MSSPAKRPKLSESGNGSLSSSQTTGPKSPPKGQSKISSFFKTATTVTSKPLSVQAAILEVLDVDENELTDMSSIEVPTPLPSQPAPPPARVTTSQSVNTSMDSDTTVGRSFLDRTLAEFSSQSQRSISEMDAEEQREYDKSMKQREKNREKYAFLDDPLDGMRRSRSDPNYDPRTLHIPANTYYNMTDFERQYWDIKSKYFNYIVFFQKGIFYEIMEVDADIASRELGLAPMHRAGMRSCGFSMKDGDANAERLVQRGHSVVMVDQVETPVDRASSSRSGNDAASTNLLSPSSRLGNGSSSGSSGSLFSSSDSDPSSSGSNPKKRKAATPDPEKMLRRVIRRILTPGTTPEAAVESARAVFLLSISELVETSPLAHTTFGICLFDTSAGSFISGMLVEDDLESYTKLRTLLFYSRPREVLFCKGNLSKHVAQLVKLYSHENVLLRPRRETTGAHLTAVVTQLDELRSNISADNEPIALQRARGSTQTLNALALTFDFLDETKNLETLQHASWVTLDDYCRNQTGSSMVLDARALENLSLLEGEDRSAKNSIFGFLDRTVTRFGRRMLFEWTCHPLQSPFLVEARLRSVDFLIAQPDFAAQLSQVLTRFKSVDLERCIALACSSRLQLKYFVDFLDALHVVSSAYTHHWRQWIENGISGDDGSTHPLPRLLNTILGSFEGNADMRERNDNGGTTDWHLRKLEFPDVEVENDAHAELAFFREAFDRPSYTEDKKLIPNRGVCKPYDEAMSRLETVNQALVDETNRVSQFYRDAGIRMNDSSSQVVMVDAGNVLRLLEVPAAWVSQAGLPSGAKEHSTKSTTKLKRFYTAKIENELLMEWKEATLAAERSAGLALELFTQRLASCAKLWWRPWVKRLAEIDCLLSLASASQSDVEIQSRPQVFALPTDQLANASTTSGGSIVELDSSAAAYEIEHASSPFIALKDSVHPLLVTTAGTSRTFSSTIHLDDPTQLDSAASRHSAIISNDVALGVLPQSLQSSETGTSSQSPFSSLKSDNPLSVLLTGPNMGGKSTLLRQVCLAVTMAQIGCYPFAKLAFTTVDRVFTRIGASDNIFAGRSTFMVELEEASAVLKYATDRSLVILDELGRGTATFDGYAIAYATLSQLALHTRCFTLFSTHYHLLTSEVETHELLRRVVSLYYMDALVDADNHTVTFLYKMALGVCPQSYGMMVAAMAKIPRDVVRSARLRSSAFQADMAAKQLQSKDLKEKYLQLASLVRNLSLKSSTQEGSS